MTARTAYAVKFENVPELGECWIVCPKAGPRRGDIISTHAHKIDAEEAAQAQARADEQSRVMSEFNQAAEARALWAEFLTEL